MKPLKKGTDSSRSFRICGKQAREALLNWWKG